MTQSSSHHIKALDGVRAASILFVIAAHTMPLGPNRFGMNEAAGLLGMSLFFCLSGFLIVSTIYRDPDPVKFLIRRVLRIVPAVFVYVAIMFVLFDISWRAVVENMLFVTNYFYEGRGRGSVAAPMTHLWSLSVEMHFYIAIGLATAVLGRKAVWLVPPAAILVTFMRIQNEAYFNIATHLRVDEILSGGILALIAIHYGAQIKAALSRVWVGWTAFAVFGGLWFLSSHSMGGDLNYLRPYFAAAFVGSIMFSNLGLLQRVLEGRVASYLARISYALYIYHPLFVFGWMSTGSDVMKYLVKRPIAWVLSLAAAHASTFWWEQRWQDLAKRLTAHRGKTNKT